MSDKYAALRAAAQEEIMCRESGDTSDAWQDEASPEFILELLAERDADRARIAEVESQRRLAFMACNRWADKFREAEQRVAELEARTLTVNLPKGWHFEECEAEGCVRGAVFSVGTGSLNIHLCDICTTTAEYSRMKKVALPKRLPFKVTVGISLKIEAE